MTDAIIEFAALERKKAIIEHNGYRLDPRWVFEQEAPELLVKRAAQYEGEAVLWDPHDDEDGFLLVMADQDDAADEFMAHMDGFIELPA